MILIKHTTNQIHSSKAGERQVWGEQNMRVLVWRMEQRLWELLIEIRANRLTATRSPMQPSSRRSGFRPCVCGAIKDTSDLIHLPSLYYRLKQSEAAQLQLWRSHEADAASLTGETRRTQCIHNLSRSAETNIKNIFVLLFLQLQMQLYTEHLLHSLPSTPAFD